MSRRSFLIAWGLGVAACLVVAVVTYGLVSSGRPMPVALSYVLWPGTALYMRLNGSLLFGSGFGDVGNFLIIAVGSAVAWSLVLGLIAYAWATVSRASRV